MQDQIISAYGYNAYMQAKGWEDVSFTINCKSENTCITTQQNDNKIKNERNARNAASVEESIQDIEITIEQLSHTVASNAQVITAQEVRIKKLLKENALLKTFWSATFTVYL